MSLYRPIYAPVLAKAHYSARTPQAMADDDGMGSLWSPPEFHEEA